ncbi:uncharacterized protein NECHADRAFT_86423 [Fusarium vanettenii 77-13-4]|uniref:Heterokaryon incompatibility domain-containing protein n=1 Tax=Fusarium vanettenii (strain ATCC MYA-4622 / CBS 123669 / FGSC 9596 / NRRL 45880 / 77-13-4) TaxID=660122 RepID=C7ZF13_FUSV7|nr:uncharacterized protein NECHADRAFT_86423 [Fusarium vanettenii 77-13-4]EEU37527.1 hypothetical protein NECHADRAFT_86423 [Fusarium vanettenii 77-13-4]
MPSQLCHRCCVLEIDDSAVGSIKSILRGSVEYLDYNRQGASRQPDPIQLDYLLEDTLPDLPVLQSSKTDGGSPCDFCQLLRDCILDSTSEDSVWAGKLNIRLQYIFREGIPEALRAYWEPPTGTESFPQGVLFALEGAQIKSWLRLAYSNPIREALDTEIITMFQDAAARSGQYYPMMEKVGSFWPSRLIKIEGSPSNKKLSLALRHEVEQSGDPSKTKAGYAALSYCWGTAKHAAKQAKTFTTTLEQRRSDIPESDLTALIRDSITVCQSLGITYLWVDALCILQDSFEDWSVESMAMSEIYAGSAITICPLDAQHCEQSFLSRRLDCQVEVPFTSKLRPRITGTYTLRYSGMELSNSADDEIPSPPDSLDRVLKNSPWMKRGWTCQEMQLSRQMLCFGKTRTWLLGTLKAITEKGDSEVPNPTILPTISEELFSNGLSDRLKAAQLWMFLVQDYTSRKLTYYKDTFPALSGIAKIFAKSLKDEYAAGLWKKDILRQLIWTITQEELQSQSALPFQSLAGLFGHLSDPANCYGPSWSWASRSLAVEYNSDTDAASTFRDEVEEINAHTKVEGPNLFGSVSGGTVRVRTRVRCLDFSKTRPYDEAKSKLSGTCHWVVPFEEEEVHCHLDWITKELPKDLSNNARVVLLLSATDWLNDETDTDNQVLGLIVYPLDKIQNAWVRVGTFICGGRPGTIGMNLFKGCTIEDTTIL